MAGGRKHNKKRRKKNWRTMLEGCFNKNPFSTAATDARNDAKEEVRDSTNNSRAQTPCSEAGGAVAGEELRQQIAEIHPPPSRTEEVPIRGILKKSQTSCSIGSGIYAEAAVDVPDALLHSLRPESEWSQVRPAYLRNGTEYHSGSRVGSCSNGAFPYQTQPSSCKSSPETPLHSLQSKGRPRPNSYHEGDFRNNDNSPAFENPYSTPDIVHRRYVKRPKDVTRQLKDILNDPQKQPTYYNVRNRRSAERTEPEGYLESPVYSRPAYMRYELDQAYAHPLQSSQTPDTTSRGSPEPPALRHPSNPVDNDPVYVQLDQIQQRKQEQRAQQRQRSAIHQEQHQDCSFAKRQTQSASLTVPTAWHGAVIMAAASAPPSRRKLLPMLEYRSPSTTKKLTKPGNVCDSTASSPPNTPINSVWKKFDSEVEVYSSRSPKSSPGRRRSNNNTRSAETGFNQRCDTRRDYAQSIRNESDQHISNYSRYVTSALPRSRDPIRKPMGSRHSLSPSNPLARVLPLGVREWSSSNAELIDNDPPQSYSNPIYDHHTAIRAAQTAAARLLAVGAGSAPQFGSEPKAQTVEVSSQIYATVTRSSKSQGPDGASYVYTSSFSWKKKQKPSHSRKGPRIIPHTNYTYNYSDDDDDDSYNFDESRAQWLNRNSRISSPYSSPPPLPPRQWSTQNGPNDDHRYGGGVTGNSGGDHRFRGEYHYQRRQYHGQSGARCEGRQEGRPPLPSYEEIIESRIRYGRARPVSWCGFGSQQVPV